MSTFTVTKPDGTTTTYDAGSPEGRAAMADATREPTEAAVTGCSDCPFEGSDHGWPECNVALRHIPEAIVMTRTGSPDWCPLREAPVLVSLRAKESS